ncbi:5-formyltetrahydrofolate cyclo-ligase [Blattabacterium cuenoti]|uniref:5-formyltetrahydrofolate cyclo-ligase n=1 Tax=Blattabacterium cuenoti TaxID=1653831 RepID=UPI00163B7A10|nr:5-formyltetrahydrofolate cyclo-ligase [Blattabacterium cuenoti]
MNKDSLRKKYISYRKKIPKNEFIQKNYNIFFQLRKVFFYYKKIYEKKYYHLFLPIRKYNEINTFIIIDFLLKKKKYITVPYSNFDQLSIDNCFFDKKTLLQKNKYGIYEPIYKRVIPISLIEVIFIPLLIFDLKGYRVGYGKGFYDKFINLCNKNTIKIGMSFFHPIEKIIDTHDNDLSIDIGITTNKVFVFNKFKIEKL